MYIYITTLNAYIWMLIYHYVENFLREYIATFIWPFHPKFFHVAGFANGMTAYEPSFISDWRTAKSQDDRS